MAGNTLALTEEQGAHYEQGKEAAAVMSAKPRVSLTKINRNLESLRTNAAEIREEMKEAKAAKN